MRGYVSMVGDLFHVGHINLVRAVRELGYDVLVGVHSDEEVEDYKRTPVMTMDERVAAVGACKYVAEVIPAAPTIIDEDFMNKHNIDMVFHGHTQEEDHLYHDMFQVPMGGFNPSFHPDLYEKEFYMGMGETAENLSKELDISREDQEDFSVNSHKKALEACQNGNFENEIIPINFNGNEIKKDEGPREPNVEKIKSLDPAFDSDGTITAATASPISIGASAILVSSNKLAEEAGVKPEFKILSRAIAGVDWTRMGMGPLPATEKALKKANLSMDDIDIIELNEAFAAQSLYVIRKGGWDINKINLNGGAIALGHPLGCSGSRIIVTLMNVMRQKDARYGLATMCIGTGQGIATIIERTK